MSEAAPTMTVGELAERCGIDPSTAFRYLRAGKLPGVQAGHRWIIDRDRVERFLAGHEDAAGRPLIHALARYVASEPADTLALDRQSDTKELGLTWLRGAYAALGLLIEAGTLSESEIEGRTGSLA
jgi:excisionase family DNA binding protein